MKEIKKHIKRLHKIKIHDNRWLVWAVILTFIVCLLMVAYIKVSQYYVDIQNTGSGYLVNDGIEYKDQELGFALLHPKSWAIDSADKNTINFADPGNFGEGMSVGVFAVGDEAAVRKTMAIAKETAVTINGEPGKLLVVTSVQKSQEDVALVARGGRLYVIRSNSPWFNRVLSTFRFIPSHN